MEAEVGEVAAAVVVQVVAFSEVGDRDAAEILGVALGVEGAVVAGGAVIDFKKTGTANKAVPADYGVFEAEALLS